jgi:protein TonB
MFIRCNIVLPSCTAQTHLRTALNFSAPCGNCASHLNPFSQGLACKHELLELIIMSKSILILSLTAMLAMSLALSAVAREDSFGKRVLLSPNAIAETDRDRDGLRGPVRRIRTETVKLSNKGGKTVEGQRQVLETAAYDLKGGKVENAYFPIAGSATLTGRETYKYDDKGNISEMTLYNADGSLMGKEVYTYEFDFVGNWIKMTTSVVVIEAGKPSLEPTEVTYRTISYYLDESVTKLVQPGSSTTQQPATSSVTKPSTNNVSESSQVKPEKPAATTPSKTDVASAGKSVAAGSATSVSAPGGNAVTKDKTDSKVDGNSPAKSTPNPLLKLISGGVLNGKAISLPPPVYPDVARRMNAFGLVSVEVVIDTNGKVITAKALSGNNVLHAAAVQAALRARFSPTTLSGQPVKVTGVINYNFSLGK